jgi:biopolymer transport protein ExbD
MKFPRNARILRSQLDAAPVAAVFLLLVIFVMLGSLVYTPGVHIGLPATDTPDGAGDLPGTDQPTISVALDAGNRLFFANQLITERELKVRLAQAVTNSPAPLTLVVQADKSVTLENYVRLTLLARDAGIRSSLLATLPRLVATPAKP